MKRILLGSLLLLATFGIAQVNNPSDGEALGTNFILLEVFILIAVYIYVSICLRTIADKTGTADGWLAWIPIGSMYLMTKIARKPGWWLLLMFIPVVNVIIGIIIWMDIARAREKPDWVGITIIVPLVSLFTFGYLAFSGQGIYLTSTRNKNSTPAVRDKNWQKIGRE